jgi:hypothetical protein
LLLVERPVCKIRERFGFRHIQTLLPGIRGLEGNSF